VTVAVVAAVAIGAALIGGGDPDRDSDGPTSSTTTTSTTDSPSTSPSGSDSASTTTSGPAPSPLEVAKSATVLLTSTTKTFDGDRVRLQGSGSIIDASGLIMTNAHVAAPEAKGQDLLYGGNDLKDPDYLSVWIGTPDDDAPAKPSYRARVVVVDGYVDVAVLRVYATADGTPLTAALALPTVALGTTTALRTGDDVTVLGYPGISDSRGVSVTRGIVSTFVPDERMDSERAEIDTDARIAPGNSGGIAINDAGEVIGIPFATRADPEVGVLSGRIRPIDFAIPVIEAAKAGLPYESPYL
jgi:putative serine protease PepD